VVAPWSIAFVTLACSRGPMHCLAVRHSSRRSSCVTPSMHRSLASSHAPRSLRTVASSASAFLTRCCTWSNADAHSCWYRRCHSGVVSFWPEARCSRPMIKNNNAPPCSRERTPTRLAGRRGMESERCLARD
jgi:hypothetical protein